MWSFKERIREEGRRVSGGPSSIREVQSYKMLVNVHVISPAVSASWQVRILSFLSFHGDWEAVSFYWVGIKVVFQRNGFWVLEKDTPVL